jgi:hypothetical protein
MVTWTTVPNPVDGAVVTAAWGNSVKSATDLLASGRKRFRAYRSSGGVIGAGAGTIGSTIAVNLETVQFDNDGMYSGMVITVQTGGIWMLALSAEWLFNASGWRSISINTSAGTYLAADSMQAYGTVGGVNPSCYQYITACVSLSAGTVLQARVAHSASTSLAFNTADWGLSLSGFLVSA